MGKSGLSFFVPSGPDHPQSLMGPKLNQDPFSDVFQEDPTSCICVILITKKQTNKWP